MLYSFTVSNYLSFREKQTLDFTPEALKEKEEYLHIPYLFDVNSRILKSIALYGHNSHGKTNFIKAYQFFRNCIFTSFIFGKTEGFIDVDNFKLNTSESNKPSSFEIVFVLRDIKYRYACEILKGHVFREDLWYAPPKVRENYLFSRVESETKINKIWNKDSSSKVEQSLLFTKSHNLFLSVLLAQSNIPHIDAIGKWLQGNLIISEFEEQKQLAKAVLILSQNTYRGIIQRFIENADLGFTSFKEKLDSQTEKKLLLDVDFVNFLFSEEIETYELYTKHDIYNEKYKLVDQIFFELLKSESSGTIKYIILCCYLTFAIKHGQLIWIDELDSKLHYHLLDHLIKVYNGGKNNALGSQLVFTVHNTSLLTDKVLRRDQVYFVDKNQYGESSIHKMHSKENPLRHDAPMDKKYLKGEKGVSKKLQNLRDMPDLGF